MSVELWLFAAYCHHEFTAINQRLDQMMTTVAEAIQAWVDYANGLKQQLADAETQLTTAQDTITQLQATDAAEDAAQAQQLQDQIAQQVSDALAAVQNPPAEPPPAEVPAETPPADTGSADTSTPPADTSAPADVPSQQEPPA